MDRFENCFLQRQKATTFMIQALEFVGINTALYNVFNNIRERVVSASTALQNHDYETMRPLLGWLLAMGSLISIPFRHSKKKP